MKLKVKAYLAGPVFYLPVQIENIFKKSTISTSYVMWHSSFS
jgi:nucleoside 2-deoxyribosyltransferase